MIQSFENCNDGSFDDVMDMMHFGSLESLTSYDEFIYWETFGQEIHSEVRMVCRDDEWLRIMNLIIENTQQIRSITRDYIMMQLDKMVNK